jgi:hypothetical protein
VWAYDVTQEAGSSVVDAVDLFTTDLDALTDSLFDLAMSHYVAPHMSNHDLELQLTAVIRSLKATGILAMSYKEPLHPDQIVDNWEGEPREAVLATEAGVLRRRSHFNEMVAWAGGKVVKIVSEQPCERFQMIEVSVHIARTP